MSSGASLDKLDGAIINKLLDNARKPLTEVGKELGVSTATVHQRVKKLEKEGVIKSYSLTVDYGLLGFHLTVYVGIFIDNIVESQRIIKEIENIPEFTVAHLASGRFSVFGKMRCRNTEHAKDVLFRLQSIKGIKGTETMVMFEENLNSNRNLLHSIFEDLARGGSTRE